MREYRLTVEVTARITRVCRLQVDESISDSELASWIEEQIAVLQAYLAVTGPNLLGVSQIDCLAVRSKIGEGEA